MMRWRQQLKHNPRYGMFCLFCCYVRALSLYSHIYKYIDYFIISCWLWTVKWRRKYQKLSTRQTRWNVDYNKKVTDTMFELSSKNCFCRQPRYVYTNLSLIGINIFNRLIFFTLFIRVFFHRYGIWEEKLAIKIYWIV